jgi:ADP-glucose pyrophosphorylase
MLQQHVEQGADVIVGCLEMPPSKSSSFGLIRTTAVFPVMQPMIDGLNA